jgi:hypothetical protein
VTVSEVISVFSVTPDIVIPPESLWTALGEDGWLFFTPLSPPPRPAELASLIVAKLSGTLCRVPRETIHATVARQPPWFRRACFSRPLRWPLAHSDTDPGRGGEHFQGFHSSEVGVSKSDPIRGGLLDSRSEYLEPEQGNGV